MWQLCVCHRDQQWCGGSSLYVLSVDVAGFSLGSSYADKHEQPDCCAVAQLSAVWGLLSQSLVHLLEESKKYITMCVLLCVRLSVTSGLVHICSPVRLHKPLAGLFYSF